MKIEKIQSDEQAVSLGVDPEKKHRFAVVDDVNVVPILLKGKVEQDSDAGSPREWDNLGTMACWHRRYDLGDVQPSCTPSDYKLGLVEEHLPGVSDHLEGMMQNYKIDDADYFDRVNEKFDQHYIHLPLYLYDHSGITMSTSSFSCQWDSGQVGFIYVSKDAVKREYGWKRLSEQRMEKIFTYLKGEVETYDQFLRGDVHGFIVREVVEIEVNGESIEYELDSDSCWGFFGSDPKKNGMKDRIQDFDEVEWGDG